MITESDVESSSGRLRIVIVGINYAPEQTGIAPYTTQAAEHFAAQGHSVKVVTGIEHYPSWTVPTGARLRRREINLNNAVEVTRLRHYVPRKQSASRRAAYELTFGLHASRALRGPADVVIAVVPSLLSALAAQRYAERAGAKFGVWVQDLMGQAAAQSGIAGGESIARATRAIERRVLGNADAVAIVSEGFRAHVERASVSNDRIMYLPNWSHVAPPKAKRDAMRAFLGWPEDTIIALHSGNMGLKQGLENVVEAARIADQDMPGARPVHFVLMGDGNQRERLQELAANVRSISIKPPADADTYVDVLAAADVLLINEREGVKDMSLPSKLTSYFAAGRPVIAATEPTSTTAEEIRRAGAGWVIPPENPTALITAVRQATSDRDRARAAGLRGQAYASAFLSRSGGVRNCLTFLAGLTGETAAQQPAGEQVASAR